MCAAWIVAARRKAHETPFLSLWSQQLPRDPRTMIVYAMWLLPSFYVHDLIHALISFSLSLSLSLHLLSSSSSSSGKAARAVLATTRSRMQLRQLPLTTPITRECHSPYNFIYYFKINQSKCCLNHHCNFYKSCECWQEFCVSIDSRPNDLRLLPYSHNHLEIQYKHKCQDVTGNLARIKRECGNQKSYYIKIEYFLKYPKGQMIMKERPPPRRQLVPLSQAQRLPHPCLGGLVIPKSM